MLHDELSPQELRMFNELGYHLHLLTLKFPVMSYYKMVAESCFIYNKQGKAVEALRRALIAHTDKPFRHTPEFDKLVSY